MTTWINLVSHYCESVYALSYQFGHCAPVTVYWNTLHRPRTLLHCTCRLATTPLSHWPLLSHHHHRCYSRKLRVYLCVMWMRMTKNLKHRISIGVLPFVRMRIQSTTTSKWFPSWAIGPNANGLSDLKSLHTQGCCRVAHTSHGGKLHWSLNIIHHSHLSSYSHCVQVES